MLIFDYIFYRVAKFFYKKDGLDAYRAIGIISLLQGLILGVVIFAILRVIYGLSETAKYTKEAGVFGGFVAITLMVINYLRYKGKYWMYSTRWKSAESKQQSIIRGVMIIVIFIFTLFSLLWMATSAYRG